MDNTCLIGKVITSVEINNSNDILKFVSPTGNIYAEARGDCCSITWFEHVNLPYKGFPITVIDVSDLKMPDLREAESLEDRYIQYYGIKISTDKGDLIIDYRNESNGYYGGYVTWLDDQDFEQYDERWIELKGDI